MNERLWASHGWGRKQKKLSPWKCSPKRVIVCLFISLVSIACRLCLVRWHVYKASYTCCVSCRRMLKLQIPYHNSMGIYMRWHIRRWQPPYIQKYISVWQPPVWRHRSLFVFPIILYSSYNQFCDVKPGLPTLPVSSHAKYPHSKPTE